MTFEQLQLFVAVAEREHLTRAAAAVHLTPSTVSAAIRNLEAAYGVELFHRIGRRIELTEAGRLLLPEARALLTRAEAASNLLCDLGDLKRGSLSIHASQTIASYWLPPWLARFAESYPGVALNFTDGNSRTVCDAVLDGRADLGLVESRIDEPLLRAEDIASDDLILVCAADHPLARVAGVTNDQLISETWLLREPGSGTRAEFEDALSRTDIALSDLSVALMLPSNEAILSAVRRSRAISVVSALAAEPWLRLGDLRRIDYALPQRRFWLVSHKERRRSRAAEAFRDLLDIA